MIVDGNVKLIISAGMEFSFFVDADKQLMFEVNVGVIMRNLALFIFELCLWFFGDFNCQTTG